MNIADIVLAFVATVAGVALVFSLIDLFARAFARLFTDD